MRYASDARVWVIVAMLASVGCSAGGGGGGTTRSCASRSECRPSEACVDGVCVADRTDASSPADGGAPDASGVDAGVACPLARTCSGAVCCAETEECVAGFQCLPICTNARCGDNDSICCDPGEVCLDGVVCAASCAADQVVCGATLDVCCASGEVCLDAACVAPGGACADDFDCLDEGTYCEHALGSLGIGGRCLAIPTGTTCEVRPSFDRLSLDIEWHWQGVTVDDRLYDNVIASPAVGDVSGDGIPDVVVPAYAGSSLTTTVLVAIHGRTGETLWTIGGADRPGEFDMVALGNFDPTDVALEIVYRTAGDALRIVDGDGVTEIARRTSGTASTLRAAPTVADLNADGTPDVVVGCHALDGASIDTPATDFFDLGACTGNGIGATIVANLDDDPEPEITSGGVAINLDGTYLWRRAGDPHGLTAIADLDLDGTPEIAVVRAGSIVIVRALDGVVLIGPGGTWADGTFAIPGAGQGGAPTIADFDADGLPEISTAGSAAYVVYDPDCLAVPPRAGGDCAPGSTDFVRWSAATQDLSSSVTGSSVFDFQGDGVAEVIYNDECFLHVYDGATGTDVLDTFFPNSSRTAVEYPLVVDVDRDGNSEIVVTANRDQAVGRDRCPEAYSAAFGVPIAELDPAYAMGTRGVLVLGDPMDRWVRTRPIWNDFAYHVTNVGDLGESPLVELDSWTAPGVNSYRQNVQGAGVFNAPNLVVELDAVARCGSRIVRLTAVVRNVGSRGVPPGVTVSFLRTLPAPETSVGSAVTTTALLPGGSERVSLDVPDVPLEVDLRFEARVDATTASVPAVECLTDDNTDAVDERCGGIM